MEEDLSVYTERLKRETNRRYALMLAARNTDAKVAARMITGTVVSSAGPNANRDRFIAAGLTVQLPTPLLLSHDFDAPIGAITGIEIVCDEVRFTARLCTTRPTGGIDVWEEVIAQRLTACSMTAVNLGEKVVDRTFVAWGIAEISICATAADRKASVTRCWEIAPVLYADGRASRILHWERT